MLLFVCLFLFLLIVRMGVIQGKGLNSNTNNKTRGIAFFLHRYNQDNNKKERPEVKSVMPIARLILEEEREA
ncbi:MAG: hypothetical protein J3R72DRAFT_455953 [Linnemannia gamsii]|nr:MAG: hypothetical protein J3R72DRAFT_455953 [Linnemannia gamsii]